MNKNNGPKILALDIETKPLLAYVWDVWDQTVQLNQVESDWVIISWAAKWVGDPENKMMYMDQRNTKNLEDDSKLLKKIWELIDEADIVLTQNGKQFDIRKLNARFLINGYPPTSSFRHLDTKLIAKKYFGFTSHSLDYMAEKLKLKHRKGKHGKFSGMTLWKECIKGNKEAFKEMEKYNKLDVLVLEDLYNKISPWDNSINFGIYSEDTEIVCKCGNTEFKKNGFFYSNSGKYQRYKCLSCSHETRSKENLLTKDKRKSLRVNTTR